MSSMSEIDRRASQPPGPHAPDAEPHPTAPDEEVVTPDARSLRGLAHPLRLQLLGLLRMDGPATATQLAERTGQSSGATSYHLRQLAAYGFVIEDLDRTTGRRDRYWRAAV
jgi:DNA-binding transcriptional ArsR family regulator